MLTTGTRRRPSRPRALAAVLGALVLAVVSGLPAAAVPPVDVGGERIVDEAGALAGQEDAVLAAQEDLEASTGITLYAVFVDSFDGMDPGEWAATSANISGIGSDDVLLAVAVDDSRYGFAVHPDLGLSASAQSAIRRTAIQPALGAGDWAGAVTATADALESAVNDPAGGGTTGGAVATPPQSSGGGGLLTFILLGAVAVGAFLLFRSFRKRGQQPGPADRAEPGAPEPVDVATLEAQASTALVRLDDTLRSSEQELGFAQAQFGMEETRRFAEVLAAAKKDALEAFTLRQRLDDDMPEADHERRAILTRILSLCRGAAAAIDEQTEAFDALRDLQARAPQVLAETARRADEVEDRVPGAWQTLDTLGRTYPASALASVARNPDQAAHLLAAAREAVDRGRLSVQDGDRAAAVTAARTAENAVAQAATLLDAVESAGTELAGASAAIASGIASLGSDLDDAARLAPRDPAVQSAAMHARAIRDRARSAGTDTDPLALLHELREAEAELDRALEPARGQAEQAGRARRQLDEALGPVSSRVQAVTAFIDTRRGAVGPEARTRITEAQRLLHEADSLRREDPARGLALVQRADALAGTAQAIAQQDVDEFERSRFGGGGGFGGGGYGRTNAGSLILGGILLDSVLRGGVGHGGGFGGGGFGGGWGGGGGFGGGGGDFGGGGFGGGGGDF